MGCCFPLASQSVHADLNFPCRDLRFLSVGAVVATGLTGANKNHLRISLVMSKRRYHLSDVRLLPQHVCP